MNLTSSRMFLLRQTLKQNFTPQLKSQQEQKTNNYPVPFPITDNAFRLSWDKLKKRAAISDLKFHDLRHEAISRFFEAGLSLVEVATISGHKDPKMLFRYTHLKAEDIAAKLGKLG